MQLEEIRSKKWNVSEQFKVAYSDSRSLLKEERECHFNCAIEKDISVTCSLQSKITTLSKSSLFTLTHAVVSKETDFVLEIRGMLDKKGLSVRKASRKLTEQQKKDIGERLSAARIQA